ncbi:hypothetical protein V8E54_008081 [Elaphomyces granulatus]
MPTEGEIRLLAMSSDQLLAVSGLPAMSSDVRMPAVGLHSNFGLPAMSSDVRMPAVGLHSNFGLPAMSSDVRMPAVGLHSNFGRLRTPCHVFGSTLAVSGLPAMSSDVRMPAVGLHSNFGLPAMSSDQLLAVSGLPAMSSDVRMPAVGLNRFSSAIVQFSYRWESKRNTAPIDRCDSMLLGETLYSCGLVIDSSTDTCIVARFCRHRIICGE